MKQTMLEEFGFLSIRGRDAIKFLQGYTTCDLDDLDDQVSLKGAICNIQGRMLASFRVIRTAEDALMLRMHRDLVVPTLDFLTKYIVFSKATMTNECDLHCIGAWQEETLPVDHFTHAENDYIVSCGNGRFERWTPEPEPIDATIVERWLDADINNGLAWVSPATSETFLPQMFNYHNVDAISFSKGCYLGQEIVARAQYKGDLKRRLFRAEGLATPPPLPGESLNNIEGRTLGTIIAASSTQFLAVLSAREPTDVLINGTQINVRPVDD